MSALKPFCLEAIPAFPVFYAPYPIYLEKGLGSRVTDVDGVERIDCVNNMTALIHGHAHPDVVAAVRKAADELMGVGAPTESEIRLAELLVARLPSVEQLRFCNSGTEAVMFAIRAARAWRERPMIARAEGCYHGSSESMDTSQVPDPSRWGSPEAPNTVPNSVGITANDVGDVLTIPFNDVEGARKLLEQNAGRLCGVVIDPFPSRILFAAASPAYLRMIRDFCTANDSLLIFDEVMSFRVSHAGAQGLVGVMPDLTALAKIIGGGLPCGAIGGPRKFMDMFDHLNGSPRVPHSGTGNGNPMVMSAGAAAIAALTPEASIKLDVLGERFRKGAVDALAQAGVAGCVQGVSSLNFIAIGPRQAPQNFRQMKADPIDNAAVSALHAYLINNGVLCNDSGAFLLSTAMTDDDIDLILDNVLSGLKNLKQQGLLADQALISADA